MCTVSAERLKQNPFNYISGFPTITTTSDYILSWCAGSKVRLGSHPIIISDTYNCTIARITGSQMHCDAMNHFASICMVHTFYANTLLFIGSVLPPAMTINSPEFNNGIGEKSNSRVCRACDVQHYWNGEAFIADFEILRLGAYVANLWSSGITDTRKSPLEAGGRS